MKSKRTIALLSMLLVAFLLIATNGFASAQSRTKKKTVRKISKNVHYQIAAVDDAFLEDLSHRAFQFFWDHSNSNTGLTLDRVFTNGNPVPSTHPSYNIASSAATGFALTSLCIAVQRNWIPSSDAKTRARISLDFLANRAFHKNGWFYHWMDQATGERRWNSEISSIDTALLLGGVLTVKQCFSDDAEIVSLATQIYNRVDFRWMLNGETYILSHGWNPETGFLASRWRNYSENSILYLLAIGAPTKFIPWRSWYRWKRDFTTYAGYRYLSAGEPIFTHQYSQAWFDFRNKRERYGGFLIDYFENSVKATFAHRQCNIDLQSRFPGYSENVWGISAMDAPSGYVVWKCPPASAEIDGTVAPYVAAASMMFAPEIAMPALNEIKSRFGKTTYGVYGFADSFNPTTNWVNQYVIGIDVGVALLGVENGRSRNVWKWFMRNPETQIALIRAKIK